MPTSDSSAELTRQVRIFKTIAFVGILGCGAIAGTALYMRRVSAPVAILIDGEPIVTVRSMGSAERVLLATEQREAGPGYGADAFVRMQRVTFEGRPGSTSIMPDDVAAEELGPKLKIHVRAYAIVVDGHVAVAVSTAEAAAHAVELVKSHYLEMTPPGVTVGEPTFVDKVVVSRESVSPSQVRDGPETAAAYFWTPTAQKTYTVRPGDSGFAISRRFHIAFGDFLVANAGRDMDKLQPGDVVNVSKEPPAIKVAVKKKVQVIEPIIAHAPASEAGRRMVNYSVTYVNGVETKRDVLDLQVLERPQARRSLD